MNNLQKNKLSTWLFNPFIYIAGGKSLLVGIFLLGVISLISYLGGSHFVGQILLVPAKDSHYMIYLIEILTSWISYTILFYLLGLILSRSSIRFIDLLGTIALSKAPFLIAAAIRMIPFFANFHIMSVNMLILTILQLLLVIWSFVLMYSAYTTCCNLKGNKAAYSFIAVIIIAETISQVLNITVFI